MAVTSNISSGVSDLTFGNDMVAKIYSPGTATNFTVAESGKMVVFSGGSAQDTKVGNMGSLFISSGGIISSTVLYNGAIINGFTVSASGGSLSMDDGVEIQNATVLSGNQAYLFNGQTASSVKLVSGASLFVSSGGSIATLQVSSGAEINFYKGAEADAVFLLSGVTVNGLTLQVLNQDIYNLSSGTIQGEAHIYSGREVTSAEVFSSGKVNIYAGGVLSAAVISGVAYVSAGGMLESAVNSGTLNISGSALSIDNYGLARVSLGAAVSGLVNFAPAQLQVFNGGYLCDATISGGSVVASGGRLENVSMLGGNMTVSGASVTSLGISGATVTATMKTFIGDAAIGNAGYLVMSDGVVSGLTVENGGVLVAAGFFSVDVDVVADVALADVHVTSHIHSSTGVALTNVTISSGGVVYARVPAAAIERKNSYEDMISSYLPYAGYATTFEYSFEAGNKFDNVLLLSGATINGFTVLETNELASTLVLSNAVVNSGATANLYDESVSNAVVSGGGLFNVSKFFSATVKDLTVSSGGSVNVQEGGILILTGRTVLDESDAIVLNRHIAHYGDYYENLDSVLTGKASSSYYSPVSRVSSAVLSGTSYTRSSTDSGYTPWTSVGTFSKTVNPYLSGNISGGTKYVPTDGGITDDHLSSASGAIYDITDLESAGGSQAILRLDFTSAGLAANEAMINDISRITTSDTGVSASVLSLENYQQLDDSARYEFVYDTGIIYDAYVIANGAAGFGNKNKKLGIYEETFRIVNAAGEQLVESISIDEEGYGTSGTKTFYLKRVDDHLYMEIYDSASSASVITCSPNHSAYTNSPVLVTAQFSQSTKPTDIDSSSKQYKIVYADNTSTGWMDYHVYDGVTMTKNGTITFRGKGSNNVSKESDVTVEGIDITAPVFTFTSKQESAGSVTVTVEAVDNTVSGYTTSGLDERKGIQYKVKDSWVNYNPEIGVTVEENCTIQFRTWDNAGNRGTGSYVVSTILTNLPTPEIFNVSPASPTNQNVTISLNFDSYASAYQVSTDGENYTDIPGTSGYVVNYTVEVAAGEEDYRTYYFRNSYGGGFYSDPVEYTVSIDKKPPEAPDVSINKEEIVPKDVGVELTATWDEDATVREYSLDNVNWNDYTEPLAFTVNRTVYFRGTDAVGNVSPVTSWTITNIAVADAPVAVPNTTDYTKDPVQLTVAEVTGTTLPMTYQYQFAGDEEWTEFDRATETISVEYNTDVYIRAIQTGTVYSSLVTTISVTKIDTTAPTIDSVSWDTSWTKDPITVEVIASDDFSGVAKMEYKIVGEEDWTEFTNTFQVTADFLVRVTDKAGNATESDRTINNYDDVAPVIEELEWNHDWTQNPVTVTVTASDALSGMAKIEYSFEGGDWQEIDYTAEALDELSGSFTLTEAGDFVVRATDNLGNEVLQDDTVKIDNTAPVIDSIDYQKWTNGSVTVTVTASDDLSGVAKIEYNFNSGDWQEIDYSTEKTAGSFTLTDLTENGTFGVRVTDNAGKIAFQSGPVQIDTTAPTIDSVSWDTSWKKDPITVTVTASDTESGVAGMEYKIGEGEWTAFTNGSTFDAEGNCDFVVRVTDIAGNAAVSGSYTIENFDGVDPVIDSLDWNGDWTNEDVTVTVAASDALSGVAKIEYSFEGGDWQEITYSTEKTAGSFTLTESGAFSVRVTDYAGNEVQQGGTVQIDNTPPVIDSLDSPEWTNGNVTVTVAASDALSGVAKIEYSFDGGDSWQEIDYSTEKTAGSFTLTDQTEDVAFSVRATDNAGNEVQAEGTVLIDTIAPTIDSVDWDSSWTNEDVTVTVTASDNLSGVAKMEYQIVGAGDWTEFTDTFRVTYNFKVRVTDGAGNAAVSDSYTIDNFDSVNPVIDSLDWNGDWTQDPVTVTVAASDALSGVAKIEYSFEGGDWQEITYSTEKTAGSFTLTESGAFSVRVTDNAGNEVQQGGTVKIDNTAPKIDSVDWNKNWTNTDVTVTVAASDTLSGVAKIEYNFNGGAWQEITYSTEKTAGSFTLTEYGSFSVRVTDKAGNEVQQEGVVQIDKIAPTIDSVDWNHDWTNAPITVTVTASDVGGGVAKLEYQIDGGDWTAFTDTFQVEGNCSFKIRAMDIIGNTTESGPYMIEKYDNVVPVIDSVDWNENWTNTDVTVTVAASDTLSGVAKIEYNFNGSGWQEITYSMGKTEGSFTVTESGTFSVRVTDNAGNEVQQGGAVQIDNTAPTIDSLKYKSWTQVPATVSVTASDALSGVAKIEYKIKDGPWQEINYSTGKTAGSFSVTEYGAFTVRVTDNAGNFTLQNGNVLLDETAPTIDSVDWNDKDWTNAPITVTVTASDVGSGVARTEYQIVGAGDWTEFTDTFQVTANFKIRVTDIAGNETVSDQYTIDNYDGVNPVVTSLDWNKNWTNKDVTVTTAGSDALSGVAKIEYNFNGGAWQEITYSTAKTAGSFTLTESGSFNVRVTDNAGNEVQQEGVVQIDKAAPKIDSLDWNPDWTQKPVTVTVAGSDALSGVAKIEYNFNGGAWQEITYSTEKTAGSFTLTETGDFKVRVTDLVGNEVQQEGVVQIDKAAPTIDSLVWNHDWSPDPVTVTVAGSDALSGVAKIEYNFNGGAWQEITYSTAKTAGSFTLTESGSFNVRVTDKAGNEVQQEGSVEIDLIAPVIDSLDWNHDWSPDPVTVTIAASDSLSGVAKIEYSFEDGDWLDITYSTEKTAGSFTLTETGDFKVRVTDNAGNEVQQEGVVLIDTVWPMIDSVDWDKNWTNVPITVTVTASDDSSGVAKTEYSLSGGSWTEFDGSFQVDHNGTMRILVMDNAGNATVSDQYTINNYDDEAPVIDSLDWDHVWTHGAVTVTVTVTASDALSGVAKIEYSFNGSEWQEITYSTEKTEGSFTLTESGVFSVRVTDNAGNEVQQGGAVISVSNDLNGDGRADIVMSIVQTGHDAYGSTGAWLIQEDQSAEWSDLSTFGAGWEIFGYGRTVADKKTSDVYLRSTSNIVGAWTTGDDGKVNGWETIGEFDADTQIVGLGDFNGNGQTDLLLRNVNGAVGCFFTGGETTGWNYFQSLGDEWKLSAVGDLNGDGRSDVVLKHDAGFAGSWLTQADGTMAWADLDTLSDSFEIAGTGDFNGDGTDDVLLKIGNYYGAWLVDSGNAVGWMGLGDLGDVSVEQIADFNGDGTDDLRIRTTAGDIGTQLVMGEDDLVWKYYGSVGSEWSTSLAALA